MDEKHKVFLGGTCNDSNWRDRLIPMLEIEYFNPVVDDWTPECIEIEEHEKWDVCDCHLYVITPRMTGVYSIAEVIESTFRNEFGPTVFCVLYSDEGMEFDENQRRSLRATASKVTDCGGLVLNSLEEVACYLNSID